MGEGRGGEGRGGEGRGGEGRGGEGRGGEGRGGEGREGEGEGVIKMQMEPERRRPNSPSVQFSPSSLCQRLFFSPAVPTFSSQTPAPYIPVME